MMDVAIAVGGAFLSAFLQVAFDRIESSRKFFNFFDGKSCVKLDEDTLDRLEITLDTISVVLEDAEDKQTKSPAVRRWLAKLKHAVNQADDLLDELNTQCLRLKLDYQLQQEETKADPLLSDINLSFDSDFIGELMPNLKNITDRLEYFVKKIHVLGLQKFDSKEKSTYRASSSSVVDKSQIFGRDDEKEKLIRMVLSDEGGASDVSVIAITGLGGIGKTTLAQLVYNDDRVKKKFLTRAWVCVSEEYDALRVTKALLVEVNSAGVDDKDDFNRLQVKLRDCLERKRFLVILDDIWNENYNDWDNLKNPLNHGSRGSKIIVTTRNDNVALMMQNEPFHHMQPIPEDQSWSLFKSHAFNNGDRTSLQEFEIIGKEIVKKCKGLPLAIKTVAGALRPKRDINVWLDILSSEIWVASGDILPALSLSYKHLPSHLKCCFAFCALFPKDIPFDKDEVVLLWMANDLVQPSTLKIGRDYFEELKSRSFFEMVNKKEYLMHDLVNDLARFVSRNTCIRLEDYHQAANLHQNVHRENELPPELLHFSYLATIEDTSRKFRELGQVHSLRTFLPIHQFDLRWQHYLTTLFFSDILPRLRRIRALNLSQYVISEVPASIGDLKHLRFLNLARTDIRKLPNNLGKCLNLQTLILANCSYLMKLPEEMKRLINLRYLDVRGVGDPLIKKMDGWLSILKNIQNLLIVVDKINGSVLGQLSTLQPCQSLVITGLENVSTVEVAKKGDLRNKNGIKYLTLEWSGIAECSDDELNIFAELHPHTDTNQLTIKGYRGTTFSGWLGDSAFSNMTTVSLQDCKNCFFLPPLGQLTALKKLHISGMDRITVVGEEFYGNSSTCKPFEALEELSFRKMAEWEIWNTPSEVEFPSLVEFRITDCPKLVGDLPFDVTSLRKFKIHGLTNLQYNQAGSLPCNPSLQVAKISDLPSLKRIPQEINHLDKLEVCRCPDLVIIPNQVDKLEIRDCPSLSLSLRSSVIKQLVIGQCKHLEFPTTDNPNSCLESLRIESCGDSIEAIPLCSFSKLRDVYIHYWENPKLFKFPNGHHQALTALQSLDIYNCDNILSFPEGGLQAPNLKEFQVWGCKKLKSLPEQMHTQLSLLCYMHIGSCPEIKCFPEGGLPSSVETLYIDTCKKMMIARKDWGLQRLPCLTKLYIGGIDDKLFPEEGLLPNSLQDLSIWECPNLEELSYKALKHLNSLQSLSIRDCPNLRCLPEEKLSLSLSEMIIFNCENLESFPEDGLTSSLSRLFIYYCPKLKAGMEREKGEDWPKVSHIPFIELDYELIS